MNSSFAIGLLENDYSPYFLREEGSKKDASDESCEKVQEAVASKGLLTHREEHLSSSEELTFTATGECRCLFKELDYWKETPFVDSKMQWRRILYILDELLYTRRGGVKTGDQFKLVLERCREIEALPWLLLLAFTEKLTPLDIVTTASNFLPVGDGFLFDDYIERKKSILSGKEAVAILQQRGEFKELYQIVKEEREAFLTNGQCSKLSWVQKTLTKWDAHNPVSMGQLHRALLLVKEMVALYRASIEGSSDEIYIRALLAKYLDWASQLLRNSKTSLTRWIGGLEMIVCSLPKESRKRKAFNESTLKVLGKKIESHNSAPTFAELMPKNANEMIDYIEKEIYSWIDNCIAQIFTQIGIEKIPLPTILRSAVNVVEMGLPDDREKPTLSGAELEKERISLLYEHDFGEKIAGAELLFEFSKSDPKRLPLKTSLYGASGDEWQLVKEIVLFLGKIAPRLEIERIEGCGPYCFSYRAKAESTEDLLLLLSLHQVLVKSIDSSTETNYVAPYLDLFATLEIDGKKPWEIAAIALKEEERALRDIACGVFNILMLRTRERPNIQKTLLETFTKTADEAMKSENCEVQKSAKRFMKNLKMQPFIPISNLSGSCIEC